MRVILTGIVQNATALFFADSHARVHKHQSAKDRERAERERQIFRGQNSQRYTDQQSYRDEGKYDKQNKLSIFHLSKIIRGKSRK